MSNAEYQKNLEQLLTDAKNSTKNFDRYYDALESLHESCPHKYKNLVSLLKIKHNDEHRHQSEIMELDQDINEQYAQLF